MNHRRRRECLMILSLLLLGQIAGGQAIAAAGIRFANLSVEHGLSQTSVQALLQDRRGFIWLGTQEGLNRYDGREFLHYFRDETDDATLAHNWIWALFEDGQGRIWIGTGGGGLDRHDPDTGGLVHFRHHPTDTATIGNDVVRALVEDREGHLWVGTDGGGVARIDDSTDAVTRLEDLPAGATLSDNRVRALHRDARGFIWVGTDGGGIDRLNPADGAISHVDLGQGSVGRRVSAITSIGDVLWVGTYESGLIRVEPDGRITRFVHGEEDPRSLSGNSVRSLFVDDEGRLWIGTDGEGLNRFVSDSEGFERHRHDATDPTSLADDHVVELFQDRGGVIWAGTYRGTSRWNPHVGTFTTVARHGDDPDQLSDNYVTSLAETADGAIWVGTYGGGLNRWDRQTDSFRHFHHDPSDPTTIGDDRVFALEPAGDALWIGTRGGGLGRMDLTTAEVRRYLHRQGDQTSLSADGVTTILNDSRGTVWVGTFVGGLNRLDDPSIGRFTRYRHDPADVRSLCSDQVLDVIEGREGNLWIGTYGGGFCHLDVATGMFTRYRHDPDDPRSLSSDRAWSLHEDAAGNLWIGTQDGGLNLWRADDRLEGRAVFVRFGRDHGLGDRGVYATETDSEGNVWFSTNRGLGKLEPATGIIRVYDVTRGLQSNEFNHGAHGRTRAGEIMFGGIAGFNIFEPESIRINTHPPQLAFTEISRLGQPVDFRPLLAAGRTLEFTHRDLLVSFEFAALDFTAPSRNRYRHRLLGFDSGWVEDRDVRRATYTNLAPGSYTLEVHASNSDGVWSQEPLRLPFAVLPAPWATWWAMTAYGLLALAAAALAYRSQARRVAVARQIQETNEALRAEMRRREQQQRAVVVAKEQAQRYLDVVEVIILSLDLRGHIRLVNQKGLRVLGYSEQELLGRNFYEMLVPPTERESVQQRFANVDDYTYSESPILSRDGAELLIAWHAVSLPATDDEPAGLLISGMDLTQVRTLERQIREAQKLEALGTLARGIAHDFNNILGAILGFAELLRSEVAAGGKAAGYLDDLEVSVERARNLVKSILTFGRQARQEPVPTLLQALVGEVLQLLRATLPAGIEVVCHCDDDAPSVMADPTQLHQLVMNLATNAIQAMEEETGGVLSVRVSTRSLSREEVRLRSGLRAGLHVILEVEDTGPGMDEFTRSRMFEPFFTTKGPSRGTGLGLSVVHGLVTQMGGDIDVESRPGCGTRVRVTLPAHDEHPAVAPQRPSADAPPPRGNETVLLVDDEPSLVELGRAMLMPLGYKVVGAVDAVQALRELERLGSVDVVVTDQNMPGMAGVALARAVKALHPRLPVVLVSGAHDPGIEDPAVDAALEKPFKLRDLALTLRQVIEG